jgi:hypothetical protein
MTAASAEDPDFCHYYDYDYDYSFEKDDCLIDEDDPGEDFTDFLNNQSVDTRSQASSCQPGPLLPCSVGGLDDHFNEELPSDCYSHDYNEDKNMDSCSGHQKQNTSGMLPNSRSPPAAPEEQQMLCIYICPNPSCNTAKCKVPDLTQETATEEYLRSQSNIESPSYFFVPISLILRRDSEMRQAAKEANIPSNRWNGSLLYHKWVELQENLKQKERSERGHPYVIAVHPVQALAQAHVISPKFPWWQSWLTVCIRAYYHTGTLRVPNHCHGLEILLALEFFGILYTSPEQLVFDAPSVQNKVKQWSRYFTHRAMLAQWVVDQLQQQQQQRQQLRKGKTSALFQQPFIFCTHPDPLEAGRSLCIEPQRQPVHVLDGGLNLLEGEGVRNKKSASLTSAQAVHSFFAPLLHERNKKSSTDDEDPHYKSPEIIPALMREDFTSYLQYVLPELEITFTVQTVELVSTHPTGLHEKKRERSLQRAVLVLTWNPSNTNLGPGASDTKKDNDPLEQRHSVQHQRDRYSSVCSSSASSVSTSSESSFTSAPTDEMAFEKLLNDSHKAVATLLQQSVQEKLVGAGIDNHGFYFHRKEEDCDKRGSGDRNNQTLDTTSTSTSSFSFNESPAAKPSKSSPSLSRTSSALSSGREKKDSQENDNHFRGEAKQPNANAGMMASPSGPVPKEQVQSSSVPWMLPFPNVNQKDTVADQGGNSSINRYGYVPSPSRTISVQVDHIYEDLYRESMSPKSARQQESMLRGATTSMSQQSPLGSASLVKEKTLKDPDFPTPAPATQQQPQHAPIPFIHASSQDPSVTSSLTRQSLTGGGSWNLPPQKTDRKDFASFNKDGDKNRRETERCRNVNKNSGTSSKKGANAAEVKHLHGGSFENRFTALLNEDKNKKDKKIRKKSKKKRTNPTKSDLNLEDMDLNFNVLGATGVDTKLPGALDEQGDECRCLSDVYELFVDDEKPAVILVPSPCTPGARHCHPVRTSYCTQSTINSLTSASDRSTPAQFRKAPKPQRRHPHIPVAEAMGITEENVNAVAAVLKLLAGQNPSATPSNPGTKIPGESQTEFSPRQTKLSSSSQAQTHSRVTRRVPPLQAEPEKTADEEGNGIEVLHIPLPLSREYPSQSSAQRLNRPPSRHRGILRRKLAKTKGSGHAGRTESRHKPVAQATMTTTKDRPKRSEGVKRIFGFFRKK